ncbi:MAG: hypothetical protein ABJO54_12400 [Hyphomicrobiales bacterium]
MTQFKGRFLESSFKILVTSPGETGYLAGFERADFDLRPIVPLWNDVQNWPYYGHVGI